MSHKAYSKKKLKYYKYQININVDLLFQAISRGSVSAEKYHDTNPYLWTQIIPSL